MAYGFLSFHAKQRPAAHVSSSRHWQARNRAPLAARSLPDEPRVIVAPLAATMKVAAQTVIIVFLYTDKAPQLFRSFFVSRYISVQ